MLGIFTKLFVIMILLCAVPCDCGDTCENDSCKAFKLNKKNLNKRLIGHGILELAANVIHDCARHCFYYKVCKSFDFNKKERPSCKLNNVTGDSAEATFEAKPGAIFSDITEWPSNMAGECGLRLCSVTQRCVPVKDSFKCTDIKCKKLPSIKNGKGILSNPGQMSYQDTAIVKCDAGHYAEKSTIECQASEEWEPATCVHIECGNIGPISNAVTTLDNPGHMAYMDTASLSCDEGYETNKASIQCQANGAWELSACEKKVCGILPPVPNGYTTLDDFNQMSYLDTATVTCDVGYQAENTSIRCQASGKWEPATCSKKVCGTVPLLKHGVTVLDNDTQMSYLDTATVICDEGYETNKTNIKYQASGVWEPSTCENIVCGVPSVTNGVAALVNEGQRSYLDMAQISCSEGYETLKSSIQCQASGEWEPSICRQIGLEDCKQIHSVKPDSPSGIYDIKLWKSGTYITVFCDMETDGGGWTVIHNRFDGSVDFYRNFSDYENGFGDVNGEFWLGLRHIQELAEIDQKSTILLEMTMENGTMGYERRSHFQLKNRDYTLYFGSSSTVSVSANVLLSSSESGLSQNTGQSFTTYDSEDDVHAEGKCAELYHGGWWYKRCTQVNLNGKYCQPGIVCADGFDGQTGHYHEGFAGFESLKASRMLITRA